MLRAQQQLEQLEGMLADPLQAANASVFYQLRGVWASCRRKLTRFAKDLTVHQSEREYKVAQGKFDNSLRAALHVIDGHIEKAERRETAITEDLREIRARREGLRGFWNYFKRRTLVVEIGSLEGALQSPRNNAWPRLPVGQSIIVMRCYAGCPTASIANSTADGRII